MTTRTGNLYLLIKMIYNDRVSGVTVTEQWTVIGVDGDEPDGV